ncbi:MAG: AbrB/MazE/SpoVT family DNA-binding domain-containing protein [Candidatus Bathyarchaeia archaeon]
MLIRRRIGPRGQIVIPKAFREYLGIGPGGEILMEAREGELAIRPGADPKAFVDGFCSAKGKLTKKVDLRAILEEEAEDRLGLH